MLEPVSKRRQVKTTFLISPVRILPSFKISRIDESLEWLEYLALLGKNEEEVNQGRKNFDEDIECMVKLQK